MRERKNIFIKNNITRDVDTISRNMETFVTFVRRTVTKEDTFFGPKLEFTLIVWTKMGLARTTKKLEESIIRGFT